MAEDIVVVGAGGFGRETLDVIESMNAASASLIWRVLGVVDDGPTQIQLERLANRGYTFLGVGAEVRKRFKSIAYSLAIGSTQVRARLANEYELAGWEPASLIHSSASVGSEVRIGPGAVICGGTQVSTNTNLGRYVHLNPGSIVGHDSILDDFVSVNPGAIVSGETTINAGALIGAGAVVLQGLSVGAGAVVGASACVTHDVDDHATVKGVPAR